MNSQFNVVFTGELRPGVERDTFISEFSRRFNCSEAKAAEVIDAGKPVMMKKATDKEVAEQFRDTLETMGMVIRLDPLPSASASAQPVPSASATPSPAGSNPYQAPQANLEESYENGEMTGPVSVPSGHGLQWLSSAFNNHFRANALAWIGAFIVFFILNIVLQIIPLIGPIILTLISPILIAGLLLGAKAQDEGEDFTVGHLFSGFSQNAGQLVLVGVFYIVATLIVVAIGFAVMGGSMAMFMSAGEAGAVPPDPAAIFLPVLLIIALSLPIMMAYWFAPALVAIDGFSALDAMKLSFTGCLKNLLPLTVYGIVLFILMLIAAIPIFLGFFILLPVMIASMYTSYRDIYYPEV